MTEQLRLVVLCTHWLPSNKHGRGSCALNLIAKDSVLGMCSTCGKFELNGQTQLIIEPRALPPAVPPKPIPEARPETPPSLATGLEYAKVEAGNVLHGTASESNQKKRKAICGKCEHRAPSYKGQNDPAGFGWCTQCGCGGNPRALLENKIKMPKMECPLKLWGAVSGTGATASSVWDTVKGVGQSVKYLLRGGNDKPTSDT